MSIAIGLALLIGVLPRIADFGEVWATIRTMTAWEVIALLAAAAWNIATYLFVMMSALPGLSAGQAFVAGQLSTAISNTVPAGSVVGIGVTYAVLSSFGHATGSIAIAAVLTGVWNTFAKFAFPIVALAILAIFGNTNPALVSAAIFGLALLVAAVGLLGGALSSDRLARTVGGWAGRAVSALRRPFRKPPIERWDESFARFRRQSIGILRRRWHWLTLATVLSHLSLYVVLLLALRHLGVSGDVVTASEAFGVFSVVRLATAVPITPGGLGLVEVGMTAGLVLAGGPESQVVAAVLVYRALTYALQVPLGAASYVIWQRRMVRVA